MWYCFWFIILVCREKILWVSIQPFITPLPHHHNSSQFISQRTNMEILPFTEYVYSNYAFWNFDNNHGVIWGIHWPTVRQTWAKTTLIIWPSLAPNLTGEPQCLWVSENTVGSESVSNNFSFRLGYFPFFNAVTMIHGMAMVPLGKSRKKEL